MSKAKNNKKQTSSNYRLAVVREDSYEEKFALSLSKRNIFVPTDFAFTRTAVSLDIITFSTTLYRIFQTIEINYFLPGLSKKKPANPERP